MNILCSVSYDGSGYCGWQKQPDKITVQSVIEEALKKIYGYEINIISAGRTDSGVHALKNYFNFEVQDNKIPLDKLPVVINNKLPQSIRTIDAVEVADTFSARYNGMRRIYEYYIEQTDITPFLRNFRLFYKRQLNIVKMNEAAKLLIGEYDFSAFKAVDCNSKTQVRTVYESYVESKNSTVIFHIEANAFLKNMVRIITGTLINIGLSRYSPDYISYIIESRNRNLAGKTVQPQGLFLLDVHFSV